MTAEAYFCSASTAFSQKHSLKDFCEVGVRLLDLLRNGDFIHGFHGQVRKWRMQTPWTLK